MHYTKSKLFRRAVWFVTVVFTLFTTPHVGLVLPYVVRSLANFAVSDAYAEEKAETAPTEETETTSQSSTMMMSETGGNGSNSAGVMTPSVDTSIFSGAAMASISIQTPPGRLGIAPNLSLTYNSYQGSGWIGMGWNIDMGSIQRSTKYGVNYNANNYAAVINGSSSDLVARTDWGTNYYGAKIEGSLSKYYYNSVTGGWQVTTKDGTQYYYGTTAASRQDFNNHQNVFKWCLDTVQDVNGNYMTVTYTKDQGQIYLSQIQYTGNGSTTPTNYVNFYLDSGRTDVPLMMIPNYPVLTAKRLKTIAVATGSGLVRAYRLTYVTSASTQRSLLSTVQEYGNDVTLDGTGTVTGGTSLPATTLSSDETLAYSVSPGPSISNMTDCYDFHSTFVQLGNFRGTGRMDILYLTTSSPYQLRVMLNNGDGTFTPGPLISNMTDCYDFHSTFVQLGDFNGDGMTDILYYTTSGKLRVMLSNGDGTFTSGPLISNMTDCYDFHSAYIRLGDFNGDGKTDIMYKTTAAYQFKIMLSNGDGSFANGVPFVISDAYAFDSSLIQLGDFNGDGMTDILYLTTSSPYQLRVLLSNGDGTFTSGPLISNMTDCYDFHNTFIQLGDFNGDGKTDFLYLTNSPYRLRVMLSNGDSTFTSGPLISNMTDCYDFHSAYIRLGDFNGDGKTDFMYKTTAANQFKVMLSNGDGSFANGVPFVISDAYAFDSSLIQLGDFNGDGMTDIMYLNNTSPYHEKLIYSVASPDLLISLTNPLGGTTSIAYTPSSAYQNTLLPFILQTVSSITQNDGLGHAYTTQYSYAGGLYDFVDREFLGFQQDTSYQMLNPSTYESMTQTWYYQDVTRQGIIEAQLTTSCEGHTRQINNTWSIGTLTTGVTYPRLDSVASTSTDVGYTPYTSSINYFYDPTYLVVTEEDKYGMAPGDTMHTYYTYANYTTPWILSKPTNVTVTNSSNAIVSSKWMTYNSATGQLLTQEVCKSDTPATGCTSSNPTQNPVTSYAYNTAYLGNTSSVTDPRGYITTFTYDTTNTFLTTTTNPLDQITTKTYDPGTGNVLSITAPYLQGTGYSISYQYDALGRPIQETRPDGGYTTYQYANLDNPATQFVEKREHITGGASVLDHYTDSFFDGMGRTYTIWATGPAGETIASNTFYDSVGRVSQKSNPYLYGIDTPVYTTPAYDGLSRVISTTYPDGGVTTASYRGLTKVVCDQLNHCTTSVYDVYQRLRQTTDPYGTITAYTYDTLGNLTQTVAASGATEQNTTTMAYDSLSKKRSMTDPDMGYWTYSYDKAGNLISQTDAKSQTITFTYDALNRLASKVYSDHTVTNTYDAAPSGSTITCASGVSNCAIGMLTQTLDNSFNENKLDLVLGLDIMQRVTQSQKLTGISSVTISKTYDTAGRTYTETLSPAGQTTNSYAYVYDVAGNTTGVWDYTLGVYQVQYTNFTAVGQPQTANYADSTETNYTYDPYMKRLATLLTQKFTNGTPVTTLQNLAYTYDLKGNILTLTDTVNSITHTYTYDNLDRLTSATGTGTNGYTQTYEYDRIGNITYKSDVGTYAYAYGSQPHAVQAAGTMSFQYDANGNMTQKVSGSGTQNITWDADNKPLSINGVQFTYDGNGNRVRKVGNTTVLYFGEVYEQRGGVGIIHLFANGQRVVSIRSDGNNQYYHANNLGSASVVTDVTGTARETIEYFPFGSYRSKQNFGGSFPNVNYTFTDQEDDNDTGFYNYGARLYDPALGRFISADSIVQDSGDLQTFNRYSYCSNNPLIYTDPSGNSWLSHALGHSGTHILDSIIEGFAAAAVFATVAILEAGTWGTATSLSSVLLQLGWEDLAIAGAAGGAVGGATSAALNGGNLSSILQGTVMGAAMGAVTAGITGGFAPVDRVAVGWAMAGIGAGVATATGGLDGLGNYAAGIMGAMAGANAVNWLADPPPQTASNVKTTGDKICDAAAKHVGEYGDYCNKFVVKVLGESMSFPTKEGYFYSQNIQNSLYLDQVTSLIKVVIVNWSYNGYGHMGFYCPGMQAGYDFIASPGHDAGNVVGWSTLKAQNKYFGDLGIGSPNYYMYKW